MYQSVKYFRQGMLKVKNEGYAFSCLNQFPKECCEFTSYLLAKYLIEVHGLSNLQMLRGKNRFKHKQRHVWLRANKLDIDITANQFSSTDKTIFFEPNSEWHKRYVIYEIELPDPSFSHYHEEYQEDFLQDYARILDHVNELKERASP